ncbi:MAG: hypothetical protein ACYS22_18945 [Planctomycetota bacterium]|jgi:hypothetical protein
MRAAHKVCGALFALGAVVGLGCEGGGGGGETGVGPADTKAPTVKVTEDKGGSTRLWVDNDTESTIVIFAAGRKRSADGAGIANGKTVAHSLGGRRAEDGSFAIDWTYEIDDPGPQARAPMEPRMVLNHGDVIAYNEPVLGPGQSWIGPKMKLKENEKAGRVTFRRLKEPVQLFEVLAARRERIPAPAERRFGWVPVERMVLDTKVATAAEGEPDQRDWVRFQAPQGGGDGLEIHRDLGGGLPKLHRYLVAEDQLWPEEHVDVPLQ